MAVGVGVRDRVELFGCMAVGVAVRDRVELLKISKSDWLLALFMVFDTLADGCLLWRGGGGAASATGSGSSATGFGAGTSRLRMRIGFAGLSMGLFSCSLTFRDFEVRLKSPSCLTYKFSDMLACGGDGERAGCSGGVALDGPPCSVANKLVWCSDPLLSKALRYALTRGAAPVSFAWPLTRVGFGFVCIMDWSEAA